MIQAIGIAIEKVIVAIGLQDGLGGGKEEQTPPPPSIFWALWNFIRALRPNSTQNCPISVIILKISSILGREGAFFSIAVFGLITGFQR